jgi:hypothetical protein
VGMIKITYPKGASMVPYGLKDGKPWLPGPKVTKLPWNGPQEDQYYLGGSTTGDHEFGITIECTYKASGIELNRTRKLVVPAHGFNVTTVLANELLSVKITTESSNEDLKAKIYKADLQGQKSDVIEQDIAKETPLIYKGNNS